MLHILNEDGNKELKHRKFPLGQEIKKHLQKIYDNFKGDKTNAGYKRLQNILSMENGIAYNEMKRLKNFFDNYPTTNKSIEYELCGGDLMRLWVENTLNRATKVIHDFKQAQKDAGISNAFIRSHEKDRQNKTSKPTQVKVKSDNVGQNIQNNDVLRYEHIIKISQQQLNEMAYPTSFNWEEFGELNSFANRIKYCDQHLKRIGIGSSRIVYAVDNDKVLKLAKNNKGIGQNEVEEENCKNGYYGGIFAHVYHCDLQSRWIEMERAKQAKNPDFQEVLNLPFKTVCLFVDWFYKIYGNINRTRFVNLAPQVEQELTDIYNNESHPSYYFLHDLYDYMSAWDLNEIGDLKRINSYGVVNRDGQKEIVIIDGGFSDDVKEKYY